MSRVWAYQAENRHGGVRSVGQTCKHGKVGRMIAICCEVFVYGYLHTAARVRAAQEIYIRKTKQYRKPYIRFDRYGSFSGGTKWDGLGSLAWIRFDMACTGLWSCNIKQSTQRPSKFILMILISVFPHYADSSLSTMTPLHVVLLCTTTSFLLFQESFVK